MENLSPIVRNELPPCVHGGGACYPNKSFGNVTFDSIASGTIVGTAVMLEGLSERIMEDLGYEKENVTVLITGGLAPIIAKSVRKFTPTFDKTLINDGLKLIYDFNQRGK